ncbi:MAG: YifB family Mg chelatase-like AAA ATPase [Clostridia bacterium]|nr:YifB family Mg chelatase-like AAA ATPase [Clostridia bacterium]
MLAKVKSSALNGIDGFIVEVEVDITNALPSFEIVGLGDAAVKESKERIRSAIKNTGLHMPAKKIVVNLAPASVKKAGALYDLPISLAVLMASDQIKTKNIEEYILLGELALDGSLRSIRGILPMVISAYQSGYKKVILPKGNAKEAAIIEGMEVFGAENLRQVAEHISGENPIEKTIVNSEELFAKRNEYDFDFADVKGLESIKRALLIAAAGGHNVALSGPPGSGKTMLAKRLPGILPDLSFEEALEATKIHSISGLLPEDVPMIVNRPFRNPHHTVSAVGLSGGGTNPKPGEVSLAHNGVLFLDELPEFRRDALEILRQPLEDREITITRTGGTNTYPCNFMLVAAYNPCPCGYLGDKNHDCFCTEGQISKYMSRISGPLLDRIDILVKVPAVSFEELEGKKSGETSAQIRERVNKARKIQLERYKGTNIFSNSQLTPELMEKYCALDSAGSNILKFAFEKMGLSGRAYNRILKVARTIADLENSENILPEHITEAIQYRNADTDKV